MARKPNYEFERRERDRLKAIKVAEKAQAKKEARERARLENAGEAAEADPAGDAEKTEHSSRGRSREDRAAPGRRVPEEAGSQDPRRRRLRQRRRPDRRARARSSRKTVCEDLKDPFRVVDIAGDALKGDPARLADEFGAMSLMGGRRVIRVRPAGEEIGGGAGEPGRGQRRRRADHARRRQPHAALEPAHAGRDRGLPGGAALLHRQRGGSRTAGRGRGAGARASRVEEDALAWIVERLGGDRGQSRSEIDKLLLYKDGDSRKAITLDDAAAVMGDTSAMEHRRRGRRHLRRRARSPSTARSTACSPRAAIRCSWCAPCSATPTSSTSCRAMRPRAATSKPRCSRRAACRAAGRCAGASRAICAAGRCGGSATALEAHPRRRARVQVDRHARPGDRPAPLPARWRKLAAARR